MKLSGKQKKTFYIIGGIVVFLAIIIVAINLILGHVIENKVREALDKQKEKKYHIEIYTVRANILTGNVNLKDLSITPDSLFLERLKNGDATQSSAIELSIPTLRFAGIDLFKALSSQTISLRKILFKKAHLRMIVGKKPKIKTPKEKLARLNIDSIYIAGIDGVDIGSIAFESCKLEIYNLENNKVMLENQELEFTIKDFYLKELDGNQNYFSLHLENIKLDLNNEKFMVPGGNYSLYFGRIYFDLAESVLELEDIAFKTTYDDKYELARKLKYTSEIYDLTVGSVKLTAIDLRRLINDGELSIDSVEVEQLNLAILMDKRLPFNEERRPKLPNEVLQNMKFPLYIGKIFLKDSYLKYQEKTENAKELMTAIMGNLNAQISFATSLKDSIRTDKSLIINMQANFMEKVPLTLNFVFPLNSRVDTFFYAGHLSSAKMNEFNQASLPALGLKFQKGDLKEINFNGSANPTISKGSMVMLYSGLEAEFVKKNEKDKNKFMSWAANTVTFKSNPGKNNKLRTANMEFNRVTYKGFGNFMWKTLQSGIMRTVIPSSKATKAGPEQKEKRQEPVKNTKKEKRKKKKDRK